MEAKINFEFKKRIIFNHVPTLNCEISKQVMNKTASRVNTFNLLIGTYSYSNWHLGKLIEIMEGIKSKSLINFLDLLFSDQAIATPFMRVPASINHHHAIEGGLLIHSVESAMIASQLVYENSANRDITVVAALLHDIGKIKSYTTNFRTTNIGKLVSHDHLTLEICAKALKELDKDWPDAAIALRHIWTSASPGSRYGFQPCTPMANIVRFADKLSADNYDNKNAFINNISKTGFVWSDKDKKFFWNISDSNIKNERRKICF